MEKKVQGNTVFGRRDFKAAVRCYTEALDQVQSTVLYANRAAAMQQLQKHDNAVEDCTRALVWNPKYVKALARRAASYRALTKLPQAVADYEALCSVEPTNAEHARLLEEVRKEMAP